MSDEVGDCFLCVTTVWTEGGVSSVNSVEVFVESYVSGDNANGGAVAYAVAQVVLKDLEDLLLVGPYDELSMGMLVCVPSVIVYGLYFAVDQGLNVFEWYKAVNLVTGCCASFGQLVSFFIAMVPM